MSSIYNFKVRAGNSGTVENETGLELVLTTNGAPVNLTGDTIVFRVVAGGVEVLRKTNPAISVNVSTGRITVPLTVADNRAIAARPGILTYEVERRKTNGTQRTLLYGQITVEPGINDD